MFMSEQVLVSVWIYNGWSLILEYISEVTPKFSCLGATSHLPHQSGAASMLKTY